MSYEKIFESEILVPRDILGVTGASISGGCNSRISPTPVSSHMGSIQLLWHSGMPRTCQKAETFSMTVWHRNPFPDEALNFDSRIVKFVKIIFERYCTVLLFNNGGWAFVLYIAFGHTCQLTFVAVICKSKKLCLPVVINGHWELKNWPALA